MTDLEKKAEVALKCLEKAVAEALDKKRRLGQYAVVWREGKIMYLDWPDGVNERLRDSLEE